MATVTRVVTKNWYTGASLHYTVYNGGLATLQARTAMTEFPAGSGVFVHENVAWNDTWTKGLIVFDDGTLSEGEEIAPPTTLSAPSLAAGTDRVTLTVTVAGVPVQNASTWVTTDAPGANVAEGPIYTDSEGHATFLLTAGDTYFLWAQKDGINPIKGQSFVAVADA